jgi:hypothetical protein
MKAITKASRINAVTQVIKNMNNGMKVVDACREVGMPCSSLYYIVGNNPEAIVDIQTIKDINNREQLGMILLRKTEILEKILQDGLSDKTSPRARLAIYIKIPQLLDELIDNLQRDEGIDGQSVEALLTGPKLVKVESRFAPTR